MGMVEGKVALVTGGASGIGKACAEKLAAEGAHVVLTDIQDAAGLAVAEGICANGGSATFLHQDVSLEAQWIEIADHLRHHHGKLDILVNNAGIAGSGKRVTDLSLEEWRSRQAINVDGVFLGVKHCLPVMREGGGNGSIINMSSIAAFSPRAGSASYCTTKAAVWMLTKVVALECADDGIRCNSIHPGVIDTPIYRSAHYTGPSADEIASTCLLKRAGTAEEIANGVLFLASSQSSYVTSQHLVIDGGRLVTGGQ
jgi:NAD(P)-dependent dehydrogenase (short-subunit alcohol dehydrogenase family)